MSLLYGCGLRIGEALSLKVQDFSKLPGGNKDAKTLRILGKGNKTRLVPILPIVTESLEEYLGSCPFVFKADRLHIPRCPRRRITALDSPTPNASDASNIRLTQERHSPRHATFIRHPFIIVGWQSKNDSRIIGSFQFKHDSEIHEG